MKIYTLLALLLTLTTLQAQDNLIKNGKFDSINSDALPSVWVGDATFHGISHPNFLKEHDAKVTIEVDNDNPFLRCVKTKSQNVALGTQIIPLEGKSGTLTVSMRARATNLVVGTEAVWHAPRLNVFFTLADGSRKHNGTPLIDKNLTDWTTFTGDFPIPEGATKVEIGVQGVGWTGTFDLDDVVVTLKP